MCQFDSNECQSYQMTKDRIGLIRIGADRVGQIDMRPLDLVDLDCATDTCEERLHPTRSVLWDRHYQEPLGA